MSIEARGDIYYIHCNDVDLRIGKSNHIILNPEVIEETYGVKIGYRSTTLEQLIEMANNNNIKAFKSFVSNVASIVKNEETPAETEPKVITVTKTIVKTIDRTEIYRRLLSTMRMITLLFILVLIIFIVSYLKYVKHISITSK